MKFKSESAGLIVWDAQKGRALCRFKNHECETDDPYICKKLIDLGYEHEGQEKQAEPKSTESDTLEDLRQEAKEKGIKNWHNMRPENLIAKLRGD